MLRVSWTSDRGEAGEALFAGARAARAVGLAGVRLVGFAVEAFGVAGLSVGADHRSVRALWAAGGVDEVDGVGAACGEQGDERQSAPLESDHSASPVSAAIRRAASALKRPCG
jgi:hypothetical protein